MNKQHSIILHFILLFLLIQSACIERVTPDTVLAKTIDKIQQNQAFQYKYHSRWDTRINESIFQDSAFVIYSRLDSSHHGFGFYANTRNFEFIYDGINYYEIDHGDQTIIRHDPDTIKSDSGYFNQKTIFAETPLELNSKITFDRINDTVVNDKKYFVYRNFELDQSKVDSTREIFREKLYFVDPDSFFVRHIKNITISGGDTLQIIDHHFHALRFENQPFDFGSIERSESLSYKEMSIRDKERELHLQQIAPGDRLLKQTYTDVDDKEVAIYGNPDKQIVIMFSFIGCGGCEYAMRELQKADYKIREGLQLYYSSRFDRKSTLKAYLQKKEFPNTGFSKESRINEDFATYIAPTFVFINPKGVVTDVISGFGEEAREKILGEKL